MNARASLLGTWLLLGVASLVTVSACSGTDTAADDDDTSSGGSADGNESSSSGGKASSSSGGKSSSSSSGGKSTSSSGGATDADGGLDEDDAGGEPVNPNPGDACVTVGTPFGRACGTCGVQTAYCTQSHVVGNYGACSEPPGGCIDPDAGLVADAGSSSSSSGSPADSGIPDAGGSSSSGGPIDAGPSGLPVLTLGTAANATTTLVLAAKQGDQLRPSYVSTQICPLAVSSTTTSYAYVDVVNPNAVAATVDFSLSDASSTDMFLVSYNAVPTTAAERLACVDYDDGCGTAAGPGCLKQSVGGKEQTVPANGHLYLYVTRYTGTSWSTPTVTAKVTGLP